MLLLKYILWCHEVGRVKLDQEKSNFIRNMDIDETVVSISLHSLLKSAYHGDDAACVSIILKLAGNDCGRIFQMMQI